MTQYDVFAAVRERGYLNGWTTEQAAARQIAKLVEELAELASGVEVPLAEDGWLIHLRRAGELARKAFDDPQRWQAVTVHPFTVSDELPDIMVPVLVLAQIMGLDVIEAARQKAIADVARGVRNGGDPLGVIPGGD